MRHVFDSVAAAALLLLFLLTDVPKADATSVQQFDPARMFAESALVVRAHRLDGSSYARDMASDGVCTDLQLEVLEVLAGQWDLAEPLVFCLPGGVTSGWKMQMVLGAPMQRVGDTYILFIKGILGLHAVCELVFWRAVRGERGRADGQGIADRFATSPGGTSCIVTHGDGQKDIALAPRSSMILSGANGIAVYDGLVRTPATCDAGEWDVIPSSWTMTPRRWAAELSSSSLASAMRGGDTVTGIAWTWHNRGTDDVASSDFWIVLSADEVIDIRVGRWAIAADQSRRIAGRALSTSSQFARQRLTPSEGHAHKTHPNCRTALGYCDYSC